MTRRALHRPPAHRRRDEALGALACLATASLCAALVRAVAPTASRETLAAGFLLAGLFAAGALLAVRAWWSRDLVLHRSPVRRQAARSVVVEGASAVPARSTAPGRGAARLGRAHPGSASAVNDAVATVAPVLAPVAAASVNPVSAQASVERRRLSGESAVSSASPIKDRATVPAEPAA